MAKLIYLLWTLAILALCDGISREVTGRRNERIFYGELAEPGAFPYMVSLRDEQNRHFCGGAIIGPRTVLTTASCVYERSPMYIYIVAGSNQLSIGGAIYATDSINIPSFYIHHITTPENDIALLYTVNPFEITSLVQSVPYSHSEIGENVVGNFAGWGKDFSTTDFLNDLMTIERETMSMEFCRYLLEYLVEIQDTHICADFGRLCVGDEGGPLVVDGEIIAVYSWGIGCEFGWPDVFTRISSFASWIDSNLL